MHWQNGQQGEALGAWVAAYNLAQPRSLAQVLQALEQLAGQLGLPGELAGWQELARQAGSG